MSKWVSREPQALALSTTIPRTYQGAPIEEKAPPLLWQASCHVTNSVFRLKLCVTWLQGLGQKTVFIEWQTLFLDWNCVFQSICRVNMRNSVFRPRNTVCLPRNSVYRALHIRLAMPSAGTTLYPNKRRLIYVINSVYALYSICLPIPLIPRLNPVNGARRRGCLFALSFEDAQHLTWQQRITDYRLIYIERVYLLSNDVHSSIPRSIEML